ncbi:MAG: DJ-1/PfpI family protein [Acidobacteria bacterium]|nr:DJ-1/PfpI family protein [Acidobacteriota bacterium]
MTTSLPFNIIIPIYEQVNLFDVTSACEMFYWMGQFWQKRKVTLTLVEAEGRVVKTLAGPKLTPDASFADYRGQNGGPPKRQAQLIWVPGAANDTTQKMLGDADYINFLREQAEGAEYVTSVCEGAMLLAQAGLLDGYEATTHWGMVSCLKTFKQVKVAANHPRYVVDRNRVTGGGISSGIDESLKIISLVAGESVAEKAQVFTQYFPEPPVNGEIPGAPCDIKIPPPPPVNTKE